MARELRRGFMVFAALAVPSFALAHGPGPGNQHPLGGTGWQNSPCATTGTTAPPCGAAPGTGALGPYGNGMPGPAAGRGPQMMQEYGISPRRGTNWQHQPGNGPGMNWRN
ncbi:hypothetical protein [Aliiruegeria lutimaris]|uniref:Uncharacterized protein n=1 Tax=Aliiruegeria lutimaris TaxID=571298 RepID=A0A1G8YI47_9RHOB|nr:hypothetical protein [Aliiruegeria lutimaris]SDK02317.1 hypothetical protein SAMN04488026_102923 [Aliiruegeria lutimaris]